MEVSNQHWARVAFMVRNMIDHSFLLLTTMSQQSSLNDFNAKFNNGNTNTSTSSVTAVGSEDLLADTDADAEPTYSSLQFWNYLDDQLVRIREQAAQQSDIKDNQVAWLEK